MKNSASPGLTLRERDARVIADIARLRFSPVCLVGGRGNRLSLDALPPSFAFGHTEFPRLVLRLERHAGIDAGMDEKAPAVVVTQGQRAQPIVTPRSPAPTMLVISVRTSTRELATSWLPAFLRSDPRRLKPAAVRYVSSLGLISSPASCSVTNWL